MRLRDILMVGTSIGVLAFSPVAFAQGETEDPDAAFRAQCVEAGAPDIEECIARLKAGGPAILPPPEEAPPPAEEPAPEVEEPAPAAEEPAPPAEEPAPPPVEEPAPPVEEPAPPPVEEPAPPVEEPAPPVEEPAPPAEEPAPPAGEQAPAAEEPAPAEPEEEAPAEPEEEAPGEPVPADEQDATQPELEPAADPALIAALDALVAASSSNDPEAYAAAEAAFLVECARYDITDLEACLAVFGASVAPVEGGQPATEAPAEEGEPATGEENAVDEAGEPVEVIPEAENTDAESAPVLDSAKDDEGSAEAGEPVGDAVEAPAEEAPAPTTDEEAQADAAPPAEEAVAAVIEEQGEAVEALDLFVPPNLAVVGEARNNGFVFNIGIHIGIYVPYRDRDRYWREGDDVSYERLRNGWIRQTVVRPNGVRIVTVWNRYGEIVRQVKIFPDRSRPIPIVWYPSDIDEDWRDPGDDLPPFRLRIPVEEYVLYADRSEEDDIIRFLGEPPLEQAARVYSIEEVKRSARLRDTIRRVEIGDLTFSTGSAEIDRSQVGSLERVAQAMLDLLERNPGEVFLVEGHTDAVGTDESNLDLSDARAESVAQILTDFYEVPPENLTTQGYGERYLKVETEAAERANRRVTVRRITPLVSTGSIAL